MSTRQDALRRLFQDDDPETVQLVKEQLLESDPATVSDLQSLLRGDDATVASHVRDVLRQISQRGAARDFMLYAKNFRNGGDLETACCLLARAFDPEADIERTRATLDAWGGLARGRLEAVLSAKERVAQFSQFLAGEIGLTGDTENYYSVENSLLPHVVESRRGIPVLLCLVYRFAGSRAGIQIEGLNLPGHFIARHDGVMFDPFHDGRILSLNECEEIIERQGLQMQPQFLERAEPRMELIRVLANLLHLHPEPEEPQRRRWLSGCINLLRA